MRTKVIIAFLVAFISGITVVGTSVYLINLATKQNTQTEAPVTTPQFNTTTTRIIIINTTPVEGENNEIELVFQ